MGKVKSHLDNISELIDFVDQTLAVISIDTHQAVVTGEHKEIFENLRDSLKTLYNWIMLPDLHEASLRVLDDAYRLREHLGEDAPKDSFDTLVSILARVRKVNNQTSDRECDEILKEIAALSMLGYGRFIVPRNRKGGNDV